MASRSEGLRVLIVGAGIGGLATAVGLRGQGHNVQMFEKSSFNNEVGVALTLPPNVDGVLKRLGLDPDQHGRTREEWLTVHTSTGELIEEVDFSKLRKFFSPNEAGLIHRVDLHDGLKQLAVSLGVKINLGKHVVSVEPENGAITLERGEVVKGDVVIGADGIHSRVRKFVAGDDKEPKPCGVSVFRFVLPSSEIAKDPIARKFLEKDGQLTVWADKGGKTFVTYPCRKNRLMNVAATLPGCIAKPSPNDPDLKEQMLSHFTEFNPQVKALMSLADKVMVWRLLDVPTLTTWSLGRTTIIGDAAHPLLPHSAQGGAQAVEDAATLTVLLPASTTPAQVPARLRLFHACRRDRVNLVQAFSRSMGMSTPGNDVPPLMPYPDYNQIVFRHDSWTHAEEALAWEENWVHWGLLKVRGLGKGLVKGVGIGVAVAMGK